MNEIDKKLAEIKSRNRKSRFIYGLIAIIVVLSLSVLYLYTLKARADERSERMQLERNKMQLDKKEIELANNELEQKNLEFQEELMKNLTLEKAKLVENISENIKRKTNDKDIIKLLDSIENTVKILSQVVSDTVIVRYYRRKADRDVVLSTIRSIDSPNFEINIKPVENDDGRFSVNTIHYGKLTKKKYVDLIKNSLENNDIKIESIKYFQNDNSPEWKNSIIEIGYEKIDNTLIRTANKSNEDYFIRMYCYNPNPEIKENISEYLDEKGYQLTKYTDWLSKPSFFSSKPTIFYYSQSSKSMAQKLKDELNQRLMSDRVQFKIQKGAGFGIKENERLNTFILHYIDTSIPDLFNSDNLQYSINLHTFNIPYKNRNEMYLLLRKYGFKNIEGVAYKDSDMPNWMTESSAVLYYSERSKDKAKEIAEIFTSLTGRNYETIKSADDNIAKNQKEYTITIHNIGN